MRNLNSKKAKKELGDLIFHISLKNEHARLFLTTNKGDQAYESEDYKFSKLSFYGFKLLIIELYEDFGISFYDDMKDYSEEKEETKLRKDLAFQDWKAVKEKEVA